MSVQGGGVDAVRASTAPTLDSRSREETTSRLRRLQAVAIGLPIAFLIAIESFRFFVIEADPTLRAEHVAIGVVVGIAIVAFAVFMFSLIERVERQIVRRNRELAAINAVSTAVQGELGVTHIVDAALEAVIERTGATEASVTVFPHDSREETALERRIVAAPHASTSALGGDMPHLIDIPLTRGTAVIGRMRLHLPEGAAEPDLLASATLQNIGHQLASAIQIGQLVDDLQRRRAEGHGLYDVLLRISNQEPLAETLAAITRHACELLHLDDAGVCLNPAAAGVLHLEGQIEGAGRLADGSLCISGAPERAASLAERAAACRLASPDGRTVGLHAPLTSPDGPIGELWVTRGAEAPFHGRERGYLTTLAELGSIAVTSARMRESERQGAILAERDRIAREMHDSLAQVLGTTHLRLRALRSRVEPFEAPAIEADLAELADLAEEAYRDVREAILGLRESSRADRGLFESLRAYLEKFSRQSGIRATLITELDRDPALSPRAEVQVIRVIQEALTNVRKHATAKSAAVDVAEEDGEVTIRIEDDGHGFDLGATLLDREAGFGLHTMRERMEAVGGTLSIDSAPGRGTRVTASVPIGSRITRPTEVGAAT